jgi:hypothetical protein
LEIQTWESTSALMSKSDNQLVEIWNSFGVYVEIIKKLSSLVDSHLVTHYINVIRESNGNQQVNN